MTAATEKEAMTVKKKMSYLVEATRTHLSLGGSCFSTTYSVMKLPPSLRGGFQDSTTESSRMFSTTGNLGGSGRSGTVSRNGVVFCNYSNTLETITRTLSNS